MKRLFFILPFLTASAVTVSALTHSDNFSDSRWDIFTTVNGLADNYVWMTASDGKGGVWAATLNGISHYDGTSWQSFSIPLPSAGSNNVLSLVMDQAGVVWCACRLGWVYSFDHGVWKVFKDGPYNPMSITVDHENVIWVATSDEHLWSFDGSVWQSCAIPIGKQPWPLCVDARNCIWVGSNFPNSHGVACYDGISWHLYSESDGLADNEVFGIASGPDGSVWFATANGVSCYSHGSWTNWHMMDGLVNEMAFSISIDKRGVVWVGHPNGLSILENGKWKPYISDSSEYTGMRVYNIMADERNWKWITPTILGSNGLIRLIDRAVPYLILTSPNGGDTLESGGIASITWDAREVNTVNIEYSLDGGTEWTSIAKGVEAVSGVNNWSVPETETNRLRIRITDASESGLSGTSTGNARISKPFIKIVEPVSGVSWAMETEHQIAWSTIGVRNVRVEYSSDGGTVWNLISEERASSHFVTWKTPSVVSSRYMIRISDAEDNGFTDSSGLFAVGQAYIHILYPSGGETWDGTSQIFTWISEGVDLVKISYSRDGGETWKTAGENVKAAPGYYFWYAEADKPAHYRFMISDMFNVAIADTTEKDSNIVVAISDEKPAAFIVSQNVPNPFNPSTTISFTIPRAERVKVDIYNLSGQKVENVLDSRMEAGRHAVTWNAEGLSAGVYLALVRAGAEVKTIKMLLLK